MQKRSVENLIIGFGKAGKTLAFDLGKAGREVVLVEQSSAMYGGTCINIGCIPSKKLSKLSLSGTPFSQAVTATSALSAALNQANYQKLAAVCEIITASARFIDPNTVQLSGADGEQQISAQRIFINTGAINSAPPIAGIDHPQVYDSTAIMRLETLPKELLIIGAGYIGLEFAFTFAQFGSKVTIIEAATVCTPREDEEITAALQKIMQERGIELNLGAQIQQIQSAGNQVEVVCAQQNYRGDAILLATGRRANTADLGLELAGVQTDARGFIVTNDHMQTSQAHIYAMGDVAGSPQFTYMSLDDYRIVKSQILGDGSKSRHNRSFAYAVFTDPPLANCGITASQAKAAGLNVRTATLPAAAIPNGKILGQSDGLLKAVIDADSGQILGAHLLCAQAHEVINFLQLAINQGLTYHAVRDFIFTHPSMSEALNDLFAQFDA